MVVGVLAGGSFLLSRKRLESWKLTEFLSRLPSSFGVMIYPMMMKVDFQSIKQVGKNPKGLIKPFSMYGIAYLFLFIIFKAFIEPELATEYLAGAVLLGAAPCTVMVFVWSTLTKGNPAYTVVQVATNDLIILIAFVPIVKFLRGVSNVSVPYSTLYGQDQVSGSWNRVGTFPSDRFAGWSSGKYAYRECHFRCA